MIFQKQELLTKSNYKLFAQKIQIEIGTKYGDPYAEN